MDDRREPLTPLRPADGSRRWGFDNARMYDWGWGRNDARNDARRGRLPWLGIFLLVLGGLLLIETAYPELEAAGSVLVLAIGLAFLIKWVLERGSASLYAGAIITALAAPGILNATGIHGSGLGTLSLGIAFLFIAVVRGVTGRGWGWQLWFGGLLALVGAIAMGSPAAGELVVPVILVILGAALLIRDGGLGARSR